MKLWLLQPRIPNEGLWDPWYDKAFGFVVIADCEDQARSLAAESAGDESGEAWMDSAESLCIELEAKGMPRVVLRDFAAA